MSKPAELPSFATDATLTGGPQAGSATRLRPSNAILGQGFYQGRRVPARMLGWLLGTISDWIAYLYNLQVKNWTLAAVDFFLGTTDLPVAGISHGSPGVLWIPETGAAKGSWYAYGASSAAPGTQTTRLPRILSATVSGPPVSAIGGMVSNTSGSIVLCTGTSIATGLTEVYKSTDHGGTWSPVGVGVTPHIGASGAGQVGFSAISGLFLSFDGSSPAHLLTSPDGATWTDRGVPTGTGGGANRPVKFLEGGGLTVALYFNGGFCVSTNGGVSWGNYTTIGGVNARDFAYCAAYGWLILGTNASIVGTSGFSSFVVVSAAFITSAQARAIASDGISRFVVTCYDDTQNPGPGVFFSDDGGTSWNMIRFSAYQETNYLPYRVSWNGEQWCVLGFPNSGGSNKYGLWTTSKI